jgi:hypothetical protein
MFNPDRQVSGILPPGWGNCLKYVCHLRLHEEPHEDSWVELLCGWKMAIC